VPCPKLPALSQLISVRVGLQYLFLVSAARSLLLRTSLINQHPSPGHLWASCFHYVCHVCPPAGSCSLEECGYREAPCVQIYLPARLVGLLNVASCICVVCSVKVDSQIVSHTRLVCELKLIKGTVLIKGTYTFQCQVCCCAVISLPSRYPLPLPDVCCNSAGEWCREVYPDQAADG
jgi:hypothetical protein